LTIQVDPEVEIFLDKTLIANQSFSQLAVQTGTYELIIVDTHNFSWNDRAIRETIQIVPGGELNRDFRSENYRKISSQPVGADIYLGSILLGQTPYTIKKELLQDQSITLRKNGFKEKSFSLTQIDETDYLKLSRLDEDDTPVFRAALGGTQINWFREGLIFTSFLSSWASFMFKREADKNFTLASINSSIPPISQQYYDQAKQFDQYAHVAIGVSVAALGVYMLIIMTQ
jgi:hypothetical protein